MGPILLFSAQAIAPQSAPPPSQMPQDPRAALLAQMEDVVAPNSIGIWPPAPGWWLLTILILVAVGATARYCINKIRSQRYRQSALRELAKLANDMGDETKSSEHAMQILKRTFFTAYPGSRHHVAGLYGRQWLSLLDKTSRKPLDKSRLIDTIDTALYQPQGLESNYTQALVDLAEKWVRHHRPMSDQVWQDIMSSCKTAEPRHV